MKYLTAFFVCLFSIHFCPTVTFAQKSKDSTVYTIKYRDTIIYRYDTVRIKHYVHSDTVWAVPSEVAKVKKKGLINSAQWGIGPSFGAYYSPFNGFDVNIGFGVQYYFLSIPSIRNPHLGHRRKK